MTEHMTLARIQGSAEQTRDAHVLRRKSKRPRSDASEGLGLGVEGNEYVDDPAHEQPIPRMTIGERISVRHTQDVFSVDGRRKPK
jgi:hypothetical protein